jgi:ADP-heptose:LPS heptosyltransferase
MGVERILVLFPGALGDFICFLSALERLACDKTVDLLARSEFADLVAPTIATRSLERYEISRLFIPGSETDSRLKSFFEPYEFIYSWMGSGQPVFVRNLEALCRGKLRLFPFRPCATRMHTADYYLSCVGETASREIFPAISLRDDALDWSQRYWQQSGLEEKKVLALAPGSGAKEKNWPADHFKRAADEWEKRDGRQALVVAGPAEEKGWKNDQDGARAIVVRGLDLAKLSALLSRCDLYLGNDSGVTHLAAALGIETVALFGPTDGAEWAPRGKRVTLIRQDVECSPCSPSVMKACSHRKCLTTLAPGEVIELLEYLLEKNETQGQT